MSVPAESNPNFRFKASENKAIKALQGKFKDTDPLLKSKNATSRNNPSHNEYNSIRINEQDDSDNEPNEDGTLPAGEPSPNPIAHLTFGFWSDFFDFLMVTDVFSLGVGIIIGTIFTDVINSFVADVITPPIGLLLGNAQLQNLFLVIKKGNTEDYNYETVKQALDDGAVTINFGMFLLSLIRFFLVTLVLFWCIQAFQVLKKEQEKFKFSQKIDEQAQKVSKLIETLAKPSPKKNPKLDPTSQSVSEPPETSSSSDVPSASTQKGSQQAGLLDFLEPEDFNPSNVKSTTALSQGRSSCIFCLKPIQPTVIRCPYCTSIINPSRYQKILEGLQGPRV